MTRRVAKAPTLAEEIAVVVAVADVEAAIERHEKEAAVAATIICPTCGWQVAPDSACAVDGTVTRG